MFAESLFAARTAILDRQVLGESRGVTGGPGPPVLFRPRNR
jgi:hypothetical protein